MSANDVSMHFQIDSAFADGAAPPSGWYHEPHVHRLELATVFRRSWHLVARRSALEASGKCVPGRIGETPILVAQGPDGSLRGFVNACRHRGYPLVEGEEQVSIFRCKFHGWTYELDGRLRRAPRSEFETSFDPTALGLIPIAVDVIDEFVWANLDASAAPLRTALPELARFCDDHGVSFGDYDFYSEIRHELDCNWKAWVENAVECYHCPVIHKQTFSDAWDTRPTEFVYVNDGKLMAQLGQPNVEASTYRRGGDDFRALFVFPSSFLQLDGLVGYVGNIVPTGPESCVVTMYIFFRRGSDLEMVADWAEMYKKTTEEDLDALRQQRAAFHAELFERAYVMAATERPIAHFHDLLRREYADGV